MICTIDDAVGGDGRMNLNEVDLHDEDDLAAARGLVNGVLISTILWAIILISWAIFFWAFWPG